ncbi:acyl-CoA dehydrogenase family protein [Desulfosarcina sp. OttesenSCG-928-A07]|nr:acyl-CoA dehydrogenase family protein [Desulfosarcina sp. OttesenSCG-928-G17]MDL2329251.1 acyl-CoA dehydrogenase family protein [Desulfosarcina sp. OttesenSCG-928-A07]
MNFQTDTSRTQIQNAVKDFVKGEFKKDVLEPLMASCAFPEKIWKKACDLGFVGIHFPESASGQGLGRVENALVVEGLCRGDASVGMCLAKAGEGADLILRFGSDIQKETWLPQVAEGEILSCFAVAEPGSGMDFTRIRTTAIRTGDEWVISGEKSLVINAGPMAGMYLVLCRTDPDADTPKTGLSVILVEADRAGITISETEKKLKLGGRLLWVNDVGFHDVRVPLDNLIGKEDQGLSQTLALMRETRVVSAAQLVGMAQGAFERAFGYVKQREQFGRKIIDFQITRQKIADMATAIEGARLLTYQAAQHLDQGAVTEKYSTMAKLAATRAALEVCDEAVQLFGGYGYIEEYEVEHFFRDVRFLATFDGTSMDQKNILAAELVKTGVG